MGKYTESELRKAAKYTAIGEGLLNDLLAKAKEVRQEPTAWKFCPGCGMEWNREEGAEQFGCWNCGFVKQ